MGGGGRTGAPHLGMSQVVLKKTEEAIDESDIVLFMIDAREGVTEADKHYARCAAYFFGGDGSGGK